MHGKGDRTQATKSPICSATHEQSYRTEKRTPGKKNAVEGGKEKGKVLTGRYEWSQNP